MYSQFFQRNQRTANSTTDEQRTAQPMNSEQHNRPTANSTTDQQQLQKAKGKYE